MSSPPLYGTPRDLEHYTRAAEAFTIARAAGLPPLMPWQRHVLEVALEVERDGRYRYGTVVLGVGRQNGKTTLLRALIAHRLVARAGELVLGVADKRSLARETWSSVNEVFEAGPLRRRWADTRRGSGAEELILANGARYLIGAATEKVGRGLSIDLALVDEAQAVSDVLEAAIPPAQIARPDPQQWIVSTAGTARSTYYRRLVELGRAATTGRLAYFEWSAAPELDPTDPATWPTANPALGFTITEARLAERLATMPLAEFEREHLNRWTHAAEHALPPSWWARAAHPDLEAPGRAVEVAVDVAGDRSSAAIAVAERVGDRVLVELADVHPGTGWLEARLAELARRYPSPPRNARDHGGPWLSAVGPAGALSDRLDARRTPHRNVPIGDYADACGALYDALRDEELVHRAQPDLDASAALAERQTHGDRWRFRRTPTSAPLIAVTLAHAAARTRPVASGTLVRTGPPPLVG